MISAIAVPSFMPGPPKTADVSPDMTSNGNGNLPIGKAARRVLREAQLFRFAGRRRGLGRRRRTHLRGIDRLTMSASSEIGSRFSARRTIRASTDSAVNTRDTAFIPVKIDDCLNRKFSVFVNVPATNPT